MIIYMWRDLHYEYYVKSYPQLQSYIDITGLHLGKVKTTRENVGKN